jgi:hypothetical protein
MGITSKMPRPTRRPPPEDPPAASAAVRGRARGRPRLSADEMQARVAAYCERYGVRPDADGFPPFPSGRRETPQHREWLAVYRALRRRGGRPADASAGRRSGPHAAPARCAVCDRALQPSDEVRAVRLGPPRATVPPGPRLHEACAELVERLRAAGPRSAARAGRLLWGPRDPG